MELSCLRISLVVHSEPGGNAGAAPSHDGAAAALAAARDELPSDPPPPPAAPAASASAGCWGRAGRTEFWPSSAASGGILRLPEKPCASSDARSALLPNPA